MEKYKVLLVDDEREAIDAIEHIIDWDEIGFEVVGEAYNGVKALEIAERCQPDVVVTDINMPYLDGLKLSKRLKDEYPHIKIIIFTGFDEFEYAKEAVHLEIEEYMLKPVNSKELLDCLNRVRSNLDKEREEKLNVKKLEDYLAESLPMLRMNFFGSLIEGRVNNEEIQKYMDNYQVKLKGPWYCCLVVHTSEHDVPDGVNPLLLSMSVQREVASRIGDKWSSEVFTYLGNTVMLVEFNNESDITELTDDCDKFCRWAERVIGAIVTIGVGTPCDKIINLNLSFEGAREAVSYRVIYGAKRAINIGEIAPKEQDYTVSSEENRMHELFKAIHLGEKEKIEEAVNKEITRLKSTVKTVNQHNLATMEMVGAFYRFCANNFMDFKEFLGEIRNPYEVVPLFDEVALSKWLCEISYGISTNLKNARNSSSRQLINGAKNIVSEQYTNPDLSLDMVCSELAVSNSYFSSLFKKEVGKSFITYLTDYRLEKAKQLIVETSDKSYEIATKVGYVDANYFSYVFKKNFGMSPSKYRTEHTK